MGMCQVSFSCNVQKPIQSSLDRETNVVEGLWGSDSSDLRTRSGARNLSSVLTLTQGSLCLPQFLPWQVGILHAAGTSVGQGP